MATATESPMQYERDLRSIQHEDKRAKDHNKKWSHKYAGVRPLAGVKYTWDTDMTQFEKVRPPKGWGRDPYTVPRSNSGKVHAKAEIDEVSRSNIDYLPSPRDSRLSASKSDGVLYSFDATESPAPVLSLEVFVKPNTKETEKLVEKEYEILDVNGDVVKGKKARRHLRKAASASPEGKVEEKLVEVDGFELV